MGVVRALGPRALPGAGRRGAVLPRAAAAADAEGLRKVRLGGERDDLHGLSSARAVGHADDPADRDLRSGVSRKTIPKHLDQPRGPHASELLDDWRHPEPRTQVAAWAAFSHRFA